MGRLSLKEKFKNFLFTSRYIFRGGEYFHDIEIKGAKSYRESIKAALQLLKDISPEDFAMANKLLDMIVESRRDFLSVCLGKGALTLRLEEDDKDVRWLAGRIWFYTKSTEAYLEYKKANGILTHVPKDEYGYKKLADGHYEIMRKLGCPYEELKYIADEMAKLDETQLGHK